MDDGAWSPRTNPLLAKLMERAGLGGQVDRDGARWQFAKLWAAVSLGYALIFVALWCFDRESVRHAPFLPLGLCSIVAVASVFLSAGVAANHAAGGVDRLRQRGVTPRQMVAAFILGPPGGFVGFYALFAGMAAPTLLLAGRSLAWLAWIPLMAALQLALTVTSLRYVFERAPDAPQRGRVDAMSAAMMAVSLACLAMLFAGVPTIERRWPVAVIAALVALGVARDWAVLHRALARPTSTPATTAEALYDAARRLAIVACLTLVLTRERTELALAAQAALVLALVVNVGSRRAPSPHTLTRLRVVGGVDDRRPALALTVVVAAIGAASLVATAAWLRADLRWSVDLAVVTALLALGFVAESLRSAGASPRVAFGALVSVPVLVTPVVFAVLCDRVALNPLLPWAAALDPYAVIAGPSRFAWAPYAHAAVALALPSSLAVLRRGRRVVDAHPSALLPPPPVSTVRPAIRAVEPLTAPPT